MSVINTGRAPYQKGQTKPKAPKRMKQRSGKPKARKSASLPLVDPSYKAEVKAMPCCACGAPAPSDIHHCKDRAPAQLSVYVYFPGYGETSADYDGIPLCRSCHDLYHRHKGEFHRLHGKDWGFIPQTRAALGFVGVTV